VFFPLHIIILKFHVPVARGGRVRVGAGEGGGGGRRGEAINKQVTYPICYQRQRGPELTF
jgi:hypothetical protein